MVWWIKHAFWLREWCDLLTDHKGKVSQTKKNVVTLEWGCLFCLLLRSDQRTNNLPLKLHLVSLTFTICQQRSETNPKWKWNVPPPNHHCFYAHRDTHHIRFWSCSKNIMFLAILPVLCFSEPRSEGCRSPSLQEEQWCWGQRAVRSKTEAKPPNLTEVITMLQCADRLANWDFICSATLGNDGSGLFQVGG